MCLFKPVRGIGSECPRNFIPKFRKDQPYASRDLDLAMYSTRPAPSIVAASESRAAILFVYQNERAESKLAQPDNVGKAFLKATPALGWEAALQSSSC